MAPWLEIGIEILDRRLGGGIPPGSIVALTASPASQAELLLYQLTAARGSLYLTADRSDRAVRDAIEGTEAPVGDPTVRAVTSEEPLDEASQLFRALPEEANLIIDPVDEFERTDRSDYQAFLNDMRDQMIETESMAVLHCLEGNGVPDNRTTTEHMADVIFDLTTSVRGTDLENRLTVPKFRRGEALTDAIKLDLRDRVAIDTSRDIA